MKVLFVCTGNICRSPTAEGVLREIAEQQQMSIHVESRGTHDYHVGNAPDDRSQAHALRRGYDLSAQRARQIVAHDFEEFDLILAMDRGHLGLLEQSCPDRHRGKLRLFLDGRDVPDPYYGGPEGFEKVLDLIEAACNDLVQAVRSATS